MYIVGLTGGIASGKTTVTEMFKNLRCNVIDAEEIAEQSKSSTLKLLTPSNNCCQRNPPHILLFMNYFDIKNSLSQ